MVGLTKPGMSEPIDLERCGRVEEEEEGPGDGERGAEPLLGLLWFVGTRVSHFVSLLGLDEWDKDDDESNEALLATGLNALVESAGMGDE